MSFRIKFNLLTSKGLHNTPSFLRSETSSDIQTMYIERTYPFTKAYEIFSSFLIKAQEFFNILK